VDGRGEVLVGIAVELFDRHVELAASDAPHSVRHPLAVTQTKPALLLPGTCLHARYKALRSDPRANAECAGAASVACRAARCSTRRISRAKASETARCYTAEGGRQAAKAAINDPEERLDGAVA
jgi:hypothetical protein